MKIVIFGLSVSSAWGNGHATLLRGLFRALDGLGHEVHFFERDAPYYAAHRDASSLPYCQLHIYSDWADNLPFARQVLRDADVAMVTSYCPDGMMASDLVLNGRARSIFYDMDTPVTLSRLDSGEKVQYLPGEGLQRFDLVLSYTGGEALELLKSKLNARCVETLYGWVDPAIHHPVASCQAFQADLSYLGTYSPDRQLALEQMLLSPAACLASRQFLIAGAMYPNPASWPSNVRHLEHVSPPDHAAFYSSSALTLNVTRGVMAAMGYCPSGRLFEAAACGTAVLSDWWTGLDEFFTPGEEILIASSTAESVAAIARDPEELKRIGLRAKERVLDCHTAEIRARRLIDLLENPAKDNQARQDTLVCRGL